MDGKTDPAIHAAVLAALESAINRALSLDPAGVIQLQELAGKVFHLKCNSPQLDLYVRITEPGLNLMGYWEGDVTTAVSGTAADFTELAGSDDPAATLINGNLSLQGDSAPLIRLQQIVAELNLDWEAPLVNVLGDVAGHQLAEMLRGIFSWSKRAADSLTRQLEEFIHEEARLTPPALELEDFYRDVQALGIEVDRLESKTRSLAKRIDALREQG